MKRILSIATFLLVTANALAQDIRVGLHITPNITWANVVKEYEEKSSKIQFAWGIRAEKNYTDRNFSVFGGVDLTSKGSKIKLKGKDDSESIFEMNYSAKYLEFPIGIKMKTRPIGELSYWFNIGLVPNIKLSEDVTIEGFDAADKSYLSSFNMSLLVGAGVQYELTEGTDLVGGLQFNNGFTDNIKNTPFDYNSRVSFNSLGLFIGVLF